jgi:hypothetical protein
MSKLVTFTVFLLSVLAVFAPQASAQSWQLLGATQSEPRLEQSIIRVGSNRGTFQAIQLMVGRNDAQIVDLRVIYGNGQPESITVRETFRAGTTSRRIRLSGGDRYIDQIIVTYRALGPVTIQIYGEPSASQRRWVELGCRSVGFLVNKDIIRLRREDGIFDAIKLRALGNRIEILDLRVVYGNGSPDDIRVRSTIPDRGETRALPLRGGQRALDRVEIVYVSQPTFRGTAVICVDGYKVGR